MDISNRGIIMKAMILCGGSGKKIWPFNDKNQKSCLPVGGVPNVERIVRQLKRAEFEEITLITGYQEKQVKYLLRQYPGLHFLSATDANMNEVIAGQMSEDDGTLLYYGDIYLEDADLNHLLEVYQERGTSVLLERQVGNFDATNYICAAANEMVQAYYGHPRPHYVNARSGGVFALEGQMTEYIRNAPGRFLNMPVGGMSPDGFYLEQCLQTALEDGIEIAAVYVSEVFTDIDLPWDIMEANHLYCQHIVGSMREDKLAKGSEISSMAVIKGKISLGENSRIGDRVIIEGNCQIGNDTVIENGAIIGKNVVIGNNCLVQHYCKISDHTVIGNNNKIGYLAEVTGVTFDRVAAVHNCELYGVIGTNVDIAANCQTGIVKFNDAESWQKAGDKRYHSRFSNGVFIGDYTRTGICNVFLPGIKIGSNCALGPGFIADHDVASNSVIIVKQEIERREWGASKYGW